jgi:hypothetical protein
MSEKQLTSAKHSPTPYAKGRWQAVEKLEAFQQPAMQLLENQKVFCAIANFNVVRKKAP